MSRFNLLRGRAGRAFALATGFAADRVFADPEHGHPVALYGQAVQKLIDWCYADSKVRGACFTAVAVGLPTLTSLAISRKAPNVALAVATWAALGGTTLGRTGTRMADLLDAGDVEAARELVPWLCSRDPSVLDADGIARATVESLAENTSDAVSGTLFWGAVLGAPGVVMHRTANTLDAMVGYKDSCWRNFGWASARFDDVLGYLPARLTGVATALVGPNHVDALRAWRLTARKHPSPNAGVVESTAAGALGVLLGGKTEYRSGTEMRPVLGVVDCNADGGADGHADGSADGSADGHADRSVGGSRVGDSGAQNSGAPNSSAPNSGAQNSINHSSSRSPSVGDVRRAVKLTTNVQLAVLAACVIGSAAPRVV